MAAKTPAKLRNQSFANNITKRGLIKNTPKEEGSRLNPYMVGLFLFVVIGSALFEIIRTATRGVFSEAD